MTNTPFDDTKILFTKQGELSNRPAWFVINRIISMSGSHLGIATKMDKYIFRLQDQPNLLKLMYNGLIPKQRVPWFSYIKKAKEETTDYDFLFKDIQKFFHWTDKDMKTMKPLLLHIVKNPQKLKKMMKFVGADINQYKKLGIDIKEDEQGLGRFMK